MTADAPPPDARHIGQLLRDAADDFSRRLNERRLFDHPVPVDVGPAQDLVLRYLDEEGTPADDLARRTGLPRAALDAILDETMIPTGFLERRGDVVGFTEQGRSSFATSRRIIAAIEDAYRHRLDHVRYATLREALAALAPRRAWKEPEGGGR